MKGDEMPKLCAFQVDQATIYINPVQVRLLRGGSAPDQTVIVFGDTHSQTLKLPLEKVREEIEAAMNGE